MHKPLKLAIGAAGGLVVVVGVVTITAAAAGVNLTDALHSPPSPALPVTAQPSPPAGAAQAATPAARLVNQAVIEAEAQVLGLKPADLARDVRQGTTVHQLATQKGISQADFQARFAAAVGAILDQDVQQGRLTPQQEQQAIKRLSARVPNWDTPPARAQAQPSPSPQ